MVLTQERAKEIVEAAKKKAMYGPWSDQLDKVMTKEEREEVNRHWNTLPGHTCFVDALMHFVRGKVYLNGNES